MKYSENELAALSADVSLRMSEKRYSHTLGVMRMTGRLAQFFPWTDPSELSAAALLHDVTKELPQAEQRAIMRRSGVSFTENDYATPSVFHSFTAPFVIARDFPAFATDNILSAVFKHTVGDAVMSTFDKIIFVSDYVEETRVYLSCTDMRNFLIMRLTTPGYPPERALDETLMRIIRLTEDNLSRRGITVNDRMIAMREALRLRLEDNI